MSKIIIAAVAAITVAGLSQGAMAQDAQAKTQAVSTASVNFDSERQVTAFYAKIARTARQVCDSNSANPIVQQADRACTERAIGDAVRNMDKPMLTAMYNVNHGTASDIRVASR